MSPVTPTPPHEIPLESAIEDKIGWAERCFAHSESRIIQEARITALLERFARAVDASHRQMLETGVAEVCRECDLNEGGSCCGKGIENRYSGLLLLINLLLGCSLPRTRRDPSSCYFLGERGCVLKARHVICINYLCRKITDRFPPDRIAPLRDREGEEIDLLFLLTEGVREALRSSPSASPP